MKKSSRIGITHRSSDQGLKYSTALLFFVAGLYAAELRAETAIASPGVLSGVLSGEEVYFQNCVFCHGDDATGNMPGVPDLATQSGWREYSEDEMVARLMKGVQNPGSSQAMPPAGGNPDLTAPQVRGAFRFMRDTLLKSE